MVKKNKEVAMKSILGRATKKDALQAILDVDKALAGKPSSYSRVELPIPASKKEILETRKALHLTQRVFAETVGVSIQTVKSWESGDRKPEGPATKLIRFLRSKPALMSHFAKI
jgi:putative transcriptional regulator